MAQSFFKPGVECSVASIEAGPGDAWTKWNRWCDCMFEPGSADWKKCVAKHCVLGWGCAQPWGTDPFNVHPGMLVAPWTDVGAAARGIPKRDASVAYTIAGATAINLAEWTPLSMWQMYWNNPAHYAFLLGQQAVVLPLIPVAGPIIAAALRAAGAAPPFQLIPAALAEVAARKLDVGKAILEPVAKGSIKNLGTALSYLGNCGVGANIPCGAGIAVKRVAQDQIDTGKINGYDPTTRAIVVFLADKGDELVTELAKAVTGSINRALATRVFVILKSGFALAKTVALSVNDQAAVDVLTLLHRAAEVGYIIADGIEQKKPIEQIADDVCDNLLKFRPSVFFNLLKQNSQAAVAMVKSAQQAQGSGFEKALAVVSAVGQGLEGIAKVILDFERQLGTSLGDLSAMFMNAVGALSGTRQAVTMMQEQVLHAATPVGTGTVSKPLATATLATRPAAGLLIPLPSLTPTPKVKPMSSNLTTLLSAAGGGVVGGVTGGPVGAVAGAAIAGAGAYFATRESASPPPSAEDLRRAQAAEDLKIAAAGAPVVSAWNVQMPVMNPTTGKVETVVARGTTTASFISPDSPLARAVAEKKAKMAAQNLVCADAACNTYKDAATGAPRALAGYGDSSNTSPMLLAALAGGIVGGILGKSRGAAIGAAVGVGARWVASRRQIRDPNMPMVVAPQQMGHFGNEYLLKQEQQAYDKAVAVTRARQEVEAANAQIVAAMKASGKRTIAPIAPTAPTPITMIMTEARPVNTKTVDTSPVMIVGAGEKVDARVEEKPFIMTATVTPIGVKDDAAAREQAAREQAAKEQARLIEEKYKAQVEAQREPLIITRDAPLPQTMQKILDRALPPPIEVVEARPAPDALVVTPAGPVPVSLRPASKFPTGLVLGAGGLAAVLILLSRRKAA